MYLHRKKKLAYTDDIFDVKSTKECWEYRLGVVELNISYDIIPLNYYSLEKLGHRPPPPSPPTPLTAASKLCNKESWVWLQYNGDCDEVNICRVMSGPARPLPGGEWSILGSGFPGQAPAGCSVSQCMYSAAGRSYKVVTQLKHSWPRCVSCVRILNHTILVPSVATTHWDS